MKQEQINIAASLKKMIRLVNRQMAEAETAHLEHMKDFQETIRCCQRECPHPSSTRHHDIYDPWDECDYCGAEL